MFGPGTYVLGGGAILLFTFLIVGFILPSEWVAEAEARVDASPAEAFTFLDSPEGWRQWTTWPDSGLDRSGPERGAGARIAWSDRELGSGSFTIAETRGEEFVRYAVEVAGAGNSVLRTDGTVELTPDGDGVRVRWRETGDLGSNPLMGYWALSMERMQSEEMAKGLDRLGALLAAQSSPTGGSDGPDSVVPGRSNSDSVPSR